MNLSTGFQFSWPLIYYFFRQFISPDTNHNCQRLEGESPNSNEYIHTYVCVHVYIKLLPVKAGGKLLNKAMENVKQHVAA